MAQFTTRVQLIDVADADYDSLHDAMELKGFEREIEGDKGTRKLPHAEYAYEGNKTRGDVLQLAKDAVATTRHNARILVTESVGRTWSNLEHVD